MNRSPLRWRRFFELAADLHDREPRIWKSTVRLFRLIASLDLAGRVQCHRLDLLEPAIVGMDLDETCLAVGSVDGVRIRCVQLGLVEAKHFLDRVLERLRCQVQELELKAARSWVESSPAEREAEEQRRENVLARLRVS